MKQERINNIQMISPAFTKKNIPIVLSCSEYFALYGEVFIKSLSEHTNLEFEYDILIFTKDITKNTESEIIKIVKGNSNISIRFLDINKYLGKYKLEAHSHFGIESYFRLLMPYILCNYDKACYFDCDMVVKADISKLYNIDIGDAYLGGCIDSVIVGAINDPYDRSFGEIGSWKDYCLKRLGMKNPYKYFNSGVLIFNLDKFRRNFTSEYLLDYVQEKQFYLLDQDALNALCGEDVVIIDHAWNMTNDNGAVKIPYIKKAPKEIAESYFIARENPNTVHFADRFKPWKNPNEDEGYEFWDVAMKLPQYIKILQRMNLEMIENACLNIPTGDNVAYLPMGIKRQWINTIKEKSTVLFPYGSGSRLFLKKLYFRMRGWK